jgi:replicative DNA helicase
VGKTALALNIARNAATFFQQQKKKTSIAIWSLEMKALMLVLRMLAAESREILYNIQTGRIDDESMKRIYVNGMQKLAHLNILFDDRSGLTIQKMRSKARKMKRKNNLGLIIVDYLQLMTPEERSGTREQEVSKISRALKNLAQELDVPIIALSQMSREVEKRTGHQRRPQLSDLRESGSLEQDADVVCFLWAPSEEDIAADASLLNKRYLRIAKQRNGVLIQMELDFKDEIQLFSEINALTGMEGNWRQVEADKFIESSKDKEAF